MSNAAGNKIAELNTIIDFPIEKVKDAILKLGNLSNTKDSAFRLLKQDVIFSSYEFYLMQANKIGGATSGRTFINLIPQENKTEIHVFSTCSTTDTYADNIHVTNVQTIQSRLLSCISDILSGKEIRQESIPQVGSGCLGSLLLFVFLAAICLLIPFLSFSQSAPLPENGSGQYEYIGKVSIHENKKEVFRRLQEWLSVKNFGEPISINTKNNKTFTGKLAAKNYDYIDTADYRIRGSGYVQYSPFRPYMYVTFDYQLTALNGAYIYDFKRFNVISFLKGKSMKAHSLRVSIYTGGGGNMSDAKSETKSLETIVAETKAKKSKMIRAQNMQDIENFKVNMQAMLGNLNRTVNGLF